MINTVMDSQTTSWIKENFEVLSSGHHGGLKNEEYLKLKRYSREAGRKIADVSYEVVKGRSSCARCGSLTGFLNSRDGYSKHCKKCKNFAAAEVRKANSGSELKESLPIEFTMLSSTDLGLNSAPIEFRHEVCGHVFEKWMRNGFRDVRCPKCFPTTRSSYEYEVKDYIESLLGNGSTIHSYHIPGTLNKTAYKEIDVYVPDRKLGIEINGLYWHSDERSKHREKMLACREVGIKLLQFTDEQWNSKRELCQSMIKTSLGLNIKIRASKCEVRHIDSKIYREFTQANHLDGYAAAKIKFGLYHEGELMQVISFSKPRFENEDSHELIRLCTKVGVTVHGGASKLLKHARPSGKIVSYSYDDVGDGGVYMKLGFERVGSTPPGYFWHKNGKIVSRYQSQKHRLRDLLGDAFDIRISESENMTRAGYSRYWNSGNTKWVLNK